MELRQILVEAFESDKNLLKLHAELVKMRAEGIDREILMAELKTFHDELENEADQDLILELLDCFYGWCSPYLRID